MVTKKSRKKKQSSINYIELIDTQVKKKYFYFLLGITVLIIFFLFLRSLFSKTIPKTFNKEKPTTIKTTSQSEQKIYLTKNGDYLWKIAEEYYGSGYNAYDIAKANNITNPNLIYSGKKILIPNVTPKIPTKGEIAQQMTSKVTLIETKYKVQANDYLWKIALAAYGDGYAWVKIAKANNLVNPDLIHPGTILNIPR